MFAALVIAALLVQSGGFRAGRAGTLPPAKPEGATNPRDAGLEIVTHATFQNGDNRETGRFLISDISAPGTVFIYVPASACERPVMSEAAPDKAAHGWRIAVTPTRRGVPAEVRAAVAVGWRREWRDGVHGRSANGFNLLQLGPPSYVSGTVLDHLSGNPSWIVIRTERPASVTRDRKYLTPTPACAAIDMSIEARLLDVPPQPVLEAELWLVHQAPSAQETTQRQTVRIRGGGSGEFFFDNLELRAAELPVTVKVSGSLDPSQPSPGKLHARVTLNRVLDLKTSATTGRSNLAIEMKVGETVCLVIPEAATPVLLGHKFSVCLRLKPLGPAEN